MYNTHSELGRVTYSLWRRKGKVGARAAETLGIRSNTIHPSGWPTVNPLRVDFRERKSREMKGKRSQSREE